MSKYVEVIIACIVRHYKPSRW